MTVPASKRSVSSMQFVETARRLARDILRFSAKIPKRYWQRLANPLCDHATEAYYHVQAANRIYVKSEADYDQRRSHLLEALGNIDHVASLLDLAFDLQSEPNENVYADIAQLIDKERQLIGGVIRRDRDARD